MEDGRKGEDHYEECEEYLTHQTKPGQTRPYQLKCGTNVQVTVSRIAFSSSLREIRVWAIPRFAFWGVWPD